MQLLEIPFDDSVIRALHSPAESNTAVVCIHGFEGTTISSKFRILEQQLRGALQVLRFDCIGQGVSDGEFRHFTIRYGVEQLKEILNRLQREYGIQEFILFSHSLGACMALELMQQDEYPISKAVMLAPALNQHDILRYLFVQRLHPRKIITWDNYPHFFKEALFRLAISRPVEVNYGYINKDFFEENRDKDYNDIAVKLRNKLFIVHGDKDKTIPVESNTVTPDIIVKKGGHALEAPKQIGQWLDRAVKYILD